MLFLKIKPLDNTFFRKGDPFNKGINNHIQSMNTPYQSTFFGAIFTALLTENDDFRQEFFNNKDKYSYRQTKEILVIKNIFLYNGFNLYIKAPLDLFIDEEQKFFNVKQGEFKKLDFINNLAFKYILENPGNNYTRVDNYYISLSDLLNKYIKNKIFNIKLKHKDDIFIKNTKVGIKLDKESCTVAESHLYSIEETEFRDNDWSYFVEYEIKNKNIIESNIQNLDNGYLKLGGEKKVCKYNKIDEKDISTIKQVQENKNEFKKDFIKILLLKELYFEENIREVFSEDSKLSIVGVSNTKPIYIGGYDMQEKASKGMYKGYPAGTIFLLEKNIENFDIRSYLNEKFDLQGELAAGNYIII